MAAVVALKVAEVAAAATVTDAGTVSVELVLVRATVAPPVGAALGQGDGAGAGGVGSEAGGIAGQRGNQHRAARLMVALAELLL